MSYICSVLYSVNDYNMRRQIAKYLLIITCLFYCDHSGILTGAELPDESYSGSMPDPADIALFVNQQPDRAGTYEDILFVARLKNDFLGFCLIIFFLLMVIGSMMVYIHKIRYKNGILKSLLHKQLSAEEHVNGKINETEGEISRRTEGIHDEKREKHLAFRRLLLYHIKIIRKIKDICGPEADEKMKTSDIVKRVGNVIGNGTGKIDYNMLLDLMPEVIKSIESRFPDKLSQKEVCTCCLFYFGFDISDIATYMDLSMNTIYMRGCQIRKKLDIAERGDIKSFLDIYL